MKTPSYLFLEDEFISNLKDFQQSLDGHFDSSAVAYSVKTNSLPYIVKTAYKSGALIEVTSSDEYLLARKIGVPINSIVYNGPLKDKETFLDAVEGGAIINIENPREVEWLKDCPVKRGIGVRVCVNLGAISPDDIKENEEQSRFGLCFENGELKNAIERIYEYGFKLDGLHVHRTSRTRSAAVYFNIARYLFDIIQDLSIDINYIDIGGGYFGGVPNKPTYDDYCKSIRDGLGGVPNCKIIVEPGSASIAAFVSFRMSVIDVKNIDNDRYIAVDGSRIDVDPFFHKKTYFYSINSIGRENIDHQIISGCTCLEKDVMFELINKPKIDVGDIIVLDKVGAYTMALTPNFIRNLPAVYTLSGNKEILVRDKWTVDEVTQKNIY